jgi:hypothetical protein
MYRQIWGSNRQIFSLNSQAGGIDLTILAFGRRIMIALNEENHMSYGWHAGW